MKAIIGLCVAAAALGIANAAMEAKKKRDLEDKEKYFDGLANEVDTDFEASEDDIGAGVGASGSTGFAGGCDGCPEQDKCGYHTFYKQPDGLRKSAAVDEPEEVRESEADKCASHAWQTMPFGKERPFTNICYDRAAMDMARKMYGEATSLGEFSNYAETLCRVKWHPVTSTSEAPIQWHFACSHCQLYGFCRAKVAELTGVDLKDVEEVTGFGVQGAADGSADTSWMDEEDEDDIDLRAIFGKFAGKGSEIGDTAGVVLSEAKEIAKDVGHKAADVGSKILNGSAKGLAASLKFAAKQAGVVSHMLDDMITVKPVVDGDEEDCLDSAECDDCEGAPEKCESTDEQSKEPCASNEPCTQGCAGCNGCEPNGTSNSYSSSHYSDSANTNK